MQHSGLISGRRVLDLCTGSGFVALAAAEMGCASVTAFDICPHAVHSTRGNAAVAGVDIEAVSPGLGPAWAWNAGSDGRLVLDPLCASASNLLCDGGSLLLVQSALAGVHRSLDCLRSTGLDAEVVAHKWIPFGPVLSARASWLEEIGLLQRGCREEQLVVIRADKP